MEIGTRTGVAAAAAKVFARKRKLVSRGVGTNNLCQVVHRINKIIKLLLLVSEQSACDATSRSPAAKGRCHLCMCVKSARQWPASTTTIVQQLAVNKRTKTVTQLAFTC